MTLRVSAKFVFEGVFETLTSNKKKSNTLRFSEKYGSHIEGHVSGHISVHHVSCGVLLGRSWCFLDDGSSGHSNGNLVLSAQGEEC